MAYRVSVFEWVTFYMVAYIWLHILLGGHHWWFVPAILISQFALGVIDGTVRMWGN